MIIELSGGETLRIKTPDGQVWEVWPAEVSARQDEYGLNIRCEQWPLQLLDTDQPATGMLFVKRHSPLA